MKRILRFLITAFAIYGLSLLSMANDLGTFERVETKTFDKQKFVFPDDVRGTRLNILFLAMSADQDNGMHQQEALLEWHAALDERGVFSAAVMPYHFPVLAGPPFFVKGMIRGAMRDSYEGKVPLDQAAVLFVDDLVEFAAAAMLPLDGQPTIVIASADAIPLKAFKGEVSPEVADEIMTAVEGLLADAN